MFSRRVDLPIPVFPMTYMWRTRSRALMPKGMRFPRLSVAAKYVTLSGLSMKTIIAYAFQKYARRVYGYSRAREVRGRTRPFLGERLFLLCASTSDALLL